MKRIIGIFLTSSLALNVFVFHAEATALKINWQTINIGLGEIYTLKANTDSKNTITWTTSDKSVVAVNYDGRIKGKKTGKATITATVNGVSAQCKVIVRNAPESIEAESIMIEEGSTENIKTKLPEGTASKGIKYKSSDTKIAKVDDNGSVTGIQRGSCFVTVTTFNGKSVNIQVAVNKSFVYKGCSFIKKGDWIYYINESDDNRIYKVRTDGTKKTRLTDFNVGSGCMQMSGDWIYFTSFGNTYKIRTDGTNLTKILDYAINEYYLIDDWFYYYESNDYEHTIYKIRTDGTQKTKIVSADLMGYGEYYIYDGWIYYNSRGELAKDKYNSVFGWWDYKYINYGLYKIKTDGTEKTFLTSDNAYIGSVNNGWVYYTNLTDSENYKENEIISRIKTNGTGKMEFSKYDTASLLVFDGWVYYSNNGIYKMRSDGTEKKCISKDNGIISTVFDGWIYFSKCPPEERYKSTGFYKMRTDGTEEKMLDSGSRGYYIEKIENNTIYYMAFDYSDAIYSISTEGTGKKYLAGCGNTGYGYIAGDILFYIYWDGSRRDCYTIHTDGTGFKEGW